MKKVNLTTEFITLGQLLKFTRIVDSGAHVKWFLDENNVLVNGEIEKRRGRKLYVGDTITVGSQKIMIGKE